MSTNIKFFDKNLVGAGCTFTFTSANTALSRYLYDRDTRTRLTSIGSNDTTDEDLIIEFGSSVTFDRILIDNHNIKSGYIKYWNGAAYVDFTSAISWSANATTVNYYEVSSVTTTKIKVHMVTTMATNDEKRVGGLFVMNQLGELTGNPNSLTDIDFKEASNKQKTANGGSLYIFFNKKFTCKLEFGNAGSTDITLIETLKNNAASFFVYLGGGSTSNIDIGMRVQDIYYVNFTGSFNPNLKNQNVNNIGQKLTMVLEEV